MKMSSKSLLLSAGMLSVIALTACAAATPATVRRPADSVTLAPCPESPNCISSQAPADDAQHYMAPLSFTGTAEEARQKLLAIIDAMPRTKVVTNEDNYIHATFTSPIFRFVDDVDFVIDEDAKQLHFRSAARVGYGDMGVNRKRMEEITSRFAAP